MEDVSLLWLLSVTSVLCCSKDQDIKRKPGEDVTLQCQGPAETDITVLKWTRSELGTDDHVFFYREKNADVIDNGTYECYVGIPGSYPKVFSIVHLKVDPVQMNITAEPGHTVTLQCQVPKHSTFKVVEWIRPDLMPVYVLWYQNRRFDPDFQHQSFKNRVELKDGDASVILKNVKTDDTGTY